ncbi:UDP-N-acetylglucosamine pyrophosphorylase/UAG1 [Blumeria hordei DH14]|uniref:UDP-N-acetylglucosamine diphosphorylase n=1 Tax=Blumeria graminis f. sp. hordei (strain DH14) TaxID=546991 RepID=N1JK82_BLUG1|nr:UDP-N-acetylglucosamine pyrophosphorylase/UAG1 [Blumeria hordei DH14]
MGNIKEISMEPTASELQKLKDKYTAAKQEQVFTFYDSLDVTEKVSLFSQLSKFDPDYINQITKRALESVKTTNDKEKLEPLPSSATASILDSDPKDIEKWHEQGLNLIADNKVGVVLMAGGQGTQGIGQNPRVALTLDCRLENHYFSYREKESINYNNWPRNKFLKEHDYFGLSKSNVTVFEQGVLPCISNDGKILLESKGKVAVAPDGNGGIYQALVSCEILTDIKKRGIEHIHAYCVDNCLVKVADPVFIGFSSSKNADIATKVVRKRNATEPVGLIMLKNGKPGVVEYSEIDQEIAVAMDPIQPGILKFRAGNIVNHYYSTRFLKTIPQWAHELPHHIARKKIPFIDTLQGTAIKPEKPNGIKLEQFVFDCFPMLDLARFACLEVKREDEFSPLKNARGTGEDDPDTSKKDIMDQGKRWAQAAGALLESQAEQVGLEISPLISYVEGLAALQRKVISSSLLDENQI